MVTNKNRIQGYISNTAYEYLEKFKIDNELSSTSQALEKILEGLAGESEEILQPAASKFKSELFEQVYDRVTSETEMFIDRKTNRLEKEIEQLEKKLSELQSSLDSKLKSVSFGDLPSESNNLESSLPNNELSSELPNESNNGSSLSKLDNSKSELPNNELPSESSSELLNNELPSELPSKSTSGMKLILPDGKVLTGSPDDKVSVRLLERNFERLKNKKPRWRRGSNCNVETESGKIITDLKILDISSDRKTCEVFSEEKGIQLTVKLDRLKRP